MAWPSQPPPPGTKTTAKPDITPTAIVAFILGIIMFLGSFLAWLKFGDDGFSAWTRSFGFFPLATFVPLAGLLTAAIVVARVFLKGSVPDAVAGFSLQQLQQLLALFALALVLGYLMMDRSELGLDIGAGFWLNLVGTLGLVTAAVLEFVAARPGAGGSDLGGFGQAPQTYQPQGQFGQPAGPGVPSPGQPGQYQPPGQPGRYPPPQGQPGQYPAQGQPAQYPTQGQPAQYPAQGQPGQYPPPHGQPGQYPAQGQPDQHQPQGQPEQYRPQTGQPHPPQGQPGQPAQSGWAAPPQQQPGQPGSSPPPPSSEDQTSTG